MAARFQTTRWSVVLAARTGQSPASREALERLCSAYWFPVYAFVRRYGYGAEDARDLTQGYFVRLIERHDLKEVDPGLGRFRSFLLASVQHFLSNELDRVRAKKRAPEQPLLSLDESDAESHYGLEPADDDTPERFFERKWARTVLDRAMARLAGEWNDPVRVRRFEALRGYLTETEAGTYAQTGESIGMSEDAVKVAVYRLRRRFGELLRAEIADTLQEPDEVDDEIRFLADALRR